jgi:erythromycin esterase-like protein
LKNRRSGFKDHVMHDPTVVQTLRDHAHHIGPGEDFERVIELIGDASIVLLGEATHGTREFYRMRAEISKRLIAGKGFDAIAVEADWPDALEVSRYIRSADAADGRRGRADYATVRERVAEEALKGFERFPQWMWRNTEIVELVEWLRGYNLRIDKPELRIGFFGLDLYSLRKSMDAVVRYLEQADPEAARVARERYSCFDHFGSDPQRYGYAATFGMRKDCEEEVIRQLVALHSEAARRLGAGGPGASDELFYAQQNARVAKNAENYYRAMFLGRDESWNVRDTHMAETLDAIREHIARRKGGPAKIIVWAHNSHIGDARATEMGEHGQLNLGQLVREHNPAGETFLLGFSTHSGTVTAASDWGAPHELKTVVHALPGSFEHLLHSIGLGDFVLPIRGNKTVADALPRRQLERAIGVIYRPETERASHYFHADMARQFDAVIHVDHSKAVRPIDHSEHWPQDEAPETYPTGI